MEYLLELRKKVILCLAFTLVVFGILCFFSNPLYQYLMRPLLLQLPSSHIIATKITAPFIMPIKLVWVVTIFLLIPFFFYQLWSFISPALYLHEKKILWSLVIPSVLLFYCGVLFAYFAALPIILNFFIQTTPNNIQLLPEIGEYLSFSLQILFAFGLAFEVPMVVLVLIYLDSFTLEEMKKARRYVIVFAFIFAMIVTPPDVFSQILLALPMWLLYELGLWLAQFLPRINRYLTPPAKNE